MNNKFSAEVLFICSPETVWSVMADAGSYKFWYGYPEGYEIIGINPGFEKNGMINFRNRSYTAVITEFEENRSLAIDSGEITDTFYIIPRDELYCTVKMESIIHGSGIDSELSDAMLENMLEKLQSICYKSVGLVSDSGETDIFHKSDFLDLPKSDVTETEKTQTPPNKDIFTESVLSTSRKGLTVSCILTLLLCAVISVTAFKGERPVVPFSEESIYEGSGVTRVSAEIIKIGQNKSQLEIMLNCIGAELPSGEYVYSSSERTSQGISPENIIVLFNSYGQVAEYIYISNERINIPLELEYWDIKHDINSDMSFAAVEQILGKELTAFKVNRHGVKTLYFGSMDLYNSYSSKELRSELVVHLNPIGKSTEVDYYPTSGERTGLPDSPEGNLEYQYRREDVYIKDRDGFERIFTLLGRKRHEVDVVLGAGDYIQEDTGSAGKYTSKFDDEHICEYAVHFNSDGEAEKIEYINKYLQDIQGTLKNPEEFGITRGMTSRELFEAVKMIPVACILSKDYQILYFGDYSDNDDGNPVATLVVEIDRSINAVNEISFIQE